MKPKQNAVALPFFVERGQIDLTAARAAAGYTTQMDPSEKILLEDQIKASLEDILSKKNLQKIRQLAVEAELDAIKEARRIAAAEKLAAKNLTSANTASPVADKPTVEEAAGDKTPPSPGNSTTAGTPPGTAAASAADQSSTDEAHQDGQPATE